MSATPEVNTRVLLKLMHEIRSTARRTRGVDRIELVYKDCHAVRLTAEPLHDDSLPTLRRLGAQRHADGKLRCALCSTDPLYLAYHDTEWGLPVHDDRRLFEMLCLEGAQAGLSWLTILRKRENYRKAFDGFDPEAMARYGAARRRRLLMDPGIVRNRLKVDAFITNAQAYLDIVASMKSFDEYICGSPTARFCAAARCTWAASLNRPRTATP